MGGSLGTALATDLIAVTGQATRKKTGGKHLSQQIITFGLHLDGQRAFSPASKLGEISVGPLGLLTILEPSLAFWGSTRRNPSELFSTGTAWRTPMRRHGSTTITDHISIPTLPYSRKTALGKAGEGDSTMDCSMNCLLGWS